MKAFIWVSDLHDSQSCEVVKYHHEFCGSLNQEWLCWRGPAEINLAEAFMLKYVS
jgi:hypothetical protein